MFAEINGASIQTLAFRLQIAAGEVVSLAVEVVADVSGSSVVDGPSVVDSPLSPLLVEVLSLVSVVDSTSVLDADDSVVSGNSDDELVVWKIGPVPPLEVEVVDSSAVEDSPVGPTSPELVVVPSPSPLEVEVEVEVPKPPPAVDCEKVVEEVVAKIGLSIAVVEVVSVTEESTVVEVPVVSVAEEDVVVSV